MMRRSTARILFIALSAMFGVFFVWPLVRILGGGLWVEGHFTLKYVRGVFANPVYAEGLRNSVMLAVTTTALAALLSVPLALLSHRVDFPGKTALSGLLLVPMILPPFVGAIGFQQMFGPYGAINALLGLGPVDWVGQGRFFGVATLQALALYPVLYLNVVAALANVDPAMEEAAENLGCRAVRRFFRITLPLIMPGLFAGGTIVFIWSFTELGTPLIMNYTRCASVQVYDELKDIGTNPFPYALVLVMLAVSVLLYAISKGVFGRKAYAMQGRASMGYAARRLRGWGAVLAAVPFAVVIAFALLPHLGVVLTSFSAPGSWYKTVWPESLTLDHYAAALGHSITVSSIRNSLLYSSLAVAANMVVGLTVAFVVVRSTVRGRWLLDALAMAPLAVPGLVMAFGYLAISSWFANLGWVKESGAWQAALDVRTNPTLFLVIAYAVRRLPYMVRSVAAGLSQTSVTLEESAANLGASPLTVVRRITVPLITANLIAGTLLAFAFCMLEVSDSIMLAQREDFYPITKTIYELFQLIGTGRYVASALGVWGMLFLTVTLVGSSVLLGKRLGALFRM